MIANIYKRNRHLLIVLLLFVPVITLFSFENCSAQDIRDSKGKEFWLTFLPNFHNNADVAEDSLYIFITAEQQASGNIEYYDIFGKKYDTTFSIGKDQFFIFSKAFKNLELSGYNSPGRGTITLNQNETIAPQAFKIMSSSDVTVYGLNQARTTSDAFIGLPSDVLGQEYMILSYPTDYSFGSPQSTPSQFAILATKNNTQVTILPTAPTFKNNNIVPQSITLNEGEVYLVQTPQNGADLTGTKVNSSQPIAVFSGHQRATVPNPSSLISRDHLVEQLPPIPTWGGSSFVTPYPLAEGAIENEFDVYRVMAANDNTKVYVDGVFKRMLQSGKYYDTELIKSEWITATGPILVAQFKKSSNEEQSFSKTGDPFMIINSPTEQYLKRFHCFNIKAWERDNSDNPIPVYDNEQYITIIVPTDSVSTVRLDGNLLDPSLFKKLSITSYSYTDSMRVETGVHTIESNVKMGVYVYGYGAANSYGYIGGMGYDTIYTFNPPDIIPPLIFGSASCGTFRGSAFDTLSFDKGLKSIETVAAGTNNATVLLGAITPPGSSAVFSAQLIDLYQDGRIEIKAIDSSNGHRERQFEIPGFTLHANPADSSPLLIEREIPAKKQICIPVVLKNYGKFDQFVSETDFVLGSKVVSISPSAFMIPPGGEKTVTICFYFKNKGTFSDTLFIKNPCIARSVAYFSMNITGDNTKPKIARNFDSCELQDNIAFTDDLEIDWGIKSFAITEQTNTLITADTSALPLKVSFTARPIDKRSDARYRIKVVDSADNIRDTTFFIQGFTLRVLDVNSDATHEFDSLFTLTTNCDYIKIYNSSELPFVLDNATLAENINFSMPLSQFPLVIPPKDTGTLIVCFKVDNYRDYSDSISLKKYCIEDVFGLRGSKKDEILSGSAQCDVRVQLSSKTIPGRAFIEKSFPNPAQDVANLRFGIASAGQVRIILFDAMGNQVATFTDAQYNSGIYELRIATDSFKSGQYYYKFTISGHEEIQPMTIIK